MDQFLNPKSNVPTLPMASNLTLNHPAFAFNGNIRGRSATLPVNVQIIPLDQANLTHNITSRGNVGVFGSCPPRLVRMQSEDDNTSLSGCGMTGLAMLHQQLGDQQHPNTRHMVKREATTADLATTHRCHPSSFSGRTPHSKVPLGMTPIISSSSTSTLQHHQNQSPNHNQNPVQIINLCNINDGDLNALNHHLSVGNAPGNMFRDIAHNPNNPISGSIPTTNTYNNANTHSTANCLESKPCSGNNNSTLWTDATNSSSGVLSDEGIAALVSLICRGDNSINITSGCSYESGSGSGQSTKCKSTTTPCDSTNFNTFNIPIEQIAHLPVSNTNPVMQPVQCQNISNISPGSTGLIGSPLSIHSVASPVASPPSTSSGSYTSTATSSPLTAPSPVSSVASASMTSMTSMTGSLSGSEGSHGTRSNSDDSDVVVPEINSVKLARTKTSDSTTSSIDGQKEQRRCKCAVCGKRFKHKANLKIHAIVHTPDAICCPICGKRFARKSNFSQHLRIHTGEKPYKCSYCKRTFAQSHR